MDAERFQISTYMHLHKLYNHKEQGWSATGPYKLYIHQWAFMKMVRESMSSKRKLFHDNPTTTVDNYFVMRAIIDRASNVGIYIIGTNESNRLPKDMETFYLQN